MNKLPSDLLDAVFLQGAGIVVEDSRFEGNRRSGVVNDEGPEGTAGILLSSSQHVLVQGNYISGVREQTRSTPLIGILGFGMKHALMRDNFVSFDAHSQGGSYSSYGVGCDPAGCACRGNVSMGPENASLGCADMGGNTHSQ